MSLHFLLYALRARFRLFLMILFATIATATVVSLLMPKTYVATASILVDSKDGQSIDTQGSPLPERERTGYMQTQLDILHSERVAKRVIKDLNLTQNYSKIPAFEGLSAKGNLEDSLAAIMLRQLKLDSSQSSIIRVGYASDNAEFSQQMANAFAKAYLSTVLELRVEPSRQTAAWFEEQVKGLRVNLEQAQARLSDFEQSKGIVASDERYDMEHNRLAELSNEVVRAQGQSFDASSRADQARETLGQGAAAERLPEVLSNPLIQTLKTDLLRNEVKLREMSSQLGVNHPQYQRQLAENQELKARIDAETKKLVDAMSQSARQTRQREAGLMGAMAEQRQRVLGLKQYRNQLSVLTRDVENAQRAYDLATQRLLASKVESAASRANLTVLNPAVTPPKPSRPKVGLNIGLSVVVGLMLALGAVGLMETFDHRVRSRADLDNEMHVPLLAELNTWNPEKTRLLGVIHPHDALPGPG